MERRLRVDWIKCDGYGLCGDYAPDLIDLDEWRYPILRPGPIPGALLDDAVRAVDCCPRRALAMVPVEGEGASPDRSRDRRRRCAVRPATVAGHDERRHARGESAAPLTRTVRPPGARCAAVP
jgi:ferredoxin